ncbi:hypothetical protein H257_02292 [Aphanomyces astaci]|uniref:Uncharacterized protein n=1 Tax=Aphanomyces astaci TaxID=112090 RepID=W4H278_APHAT|nr:hypothetical protein H257_02292 [Aphanomyces astaci]ETV85686.1 hypothetical protein H257_02292 [Aphanomyces astaci]|eukprot:XP_009824158.1 hypothetical protein H257_02292 [Aphanomyces astaci]
MRLRPEKPIVSYNNNFDRDMHNAKAAHKFWFTIDQLRSSKSAVQRTKQCISRPTDEAVHQPSVGASRSMYGSVERRRHDSSMLSMSRILDRMKENGVLSYYGLYDDPAYECR